jgi:DNA polymerase IIIc chi subunit
LSDAIAEKNRLWEAKEKNLIHHARFSRDEARNNHQIWITILKGKDNEIDRLNVVVDAAWRTGQQSNTVSRVVNLNTQLRKEKSALSKTNKDLKTDIFNLLDTKQEESKKLTQYLDETKTLRTERGEAVDEAARLRSKVNELNGFVKKLEKIIERPIINGDHAGQHHIVSEAIIKKIPMDSMSEDYGRIEKLSEALATEQNRFRDL